MFRATELTSLINSFRSEWTSAQGLNVAELLHWMLDRNQLRKVDIHSQLRGRTARYVWKEASPLNIAASLAAANSYFCHATAASIHGLLTYNPETIYINREQSPKPVPDGPLIQEAIDRAFAKEQRTSQDIYSWGVNRAVVLNGKHSGRLGVHEHSIDRTIRSPFKVTGIERTLIDMSVRPDYSGGPVQVLQAFKRARGRVNGSDLLKVLDGMAFKYPYHQSLGFYMQRAGYPKDDLAPLNARGIEFDFYIGYRIGEREFDHQWRVHFPKDL